MLGTFIVYLNVYLKSFFMHIKKSTEDLMNVEKCVHSSEHHHDQETEYHHHPMDSQGFSCQSFHFPQKISLILILTIIRQRIKEYRQKKMPYSNIRR